MKPALLALLAVLLVMALRRREPVAVAPLRTRAERDALDRLALARLALIRTGYFRPEEIGPDIAPRITELWSTFGSPGIQAADPRPWQIIADGTGMRPAGGANA